MSVGRTGGITALSTPPTPPRPSQPGRVVTQRCRRCSCWAEPLIACDWSTSPKGVSQRCSIRQVVEGHRDRMRQAVWVALWSDNSFFSLSLSLLLPRSLSLISLALSLELHICTCPGTWQTPCLRPLLLFVLETAQAEIVPAMRECCLS